MGERVIQDAVAVKVPRVVEKHEVPGLDHRSLVERAMLSKMRIDETNAVRSRIRTSGFIEIDAMLQIDCPGDAGAIVGDAAALTLDCLRTHKPLCASNDGCATGRSSG